MARWLVTGASGFVGREVVACLRRTLDPADRIFCVTRSSHALVADPDRLAADLDRTDDVRTAVAAAYPDFVIHCAGQTPPCSASLLFHRNTRRTWLLLSALRELGRPTRVVVVGSAAELGVVPTRLQPVSEALTPRPGTSYGLSKWAESTTALSMNAPGSLEVIATRIFNVIGPDMPRTNAFGRFAADLVSAEPGLVEVTVGDLESTRDFIDVRDAASALPLLAVRGKAGERYHVGSGQARSVGEGLGVLIRLSGRSVHVRPAAASVRPNDSRADVARLIADTAWSQRIPFEQSLADLLTSAVARSRAARMRNAERVA